MAELTEFQFIDRLLQQQAQQDQPFFAQPHSLGIGDDAAVLPPHPAGEQLVVSTDMLVEGQHYWPTVDPTALGHKVLAVNLSDLAAMGAKPLAFTLSAGLAQIDTTWLQAFLKGLFGLSRRYGCALVGGDTVRVPAGSPQVFSVCIWGSVPIGQALLRGGLQPGDDLWVSGHLGDPAYAVSQHRSDLKLDWPEPRVELGQALMGVAHAAIDISDGLAAEVAHLVKASVQASSISLTATLNWQAIPLGPSLHQAIAAGHLSDQAARIYAANGGDDYELCFSAPQAKRAEIESIAQRLSCPVTRVGQVSGAHPATTAHSVCWRDHHGPLAPDLVQQISSRGYDHFKASS